MRLQKPTRSRSGLSVAPYCQLPKHDGTRSLAVTRCSAGRNALSFCNLVPYDHELVPYYQYFDRLAGIADQAVPRYGGSVELADFCPFYQAFTWRDPLADSAVHRDSRCELPLNTPQMEHNPIMELYGNSSKCFDLAVSWTERKCSRVKTYTQYMAGCYAVSAAGAGTASSLQYSCTGGRVNVLVANSSRPYACTHEGQLIHVRRVSGCGASS